MEVSLQMINENLAIDSPDIEYKPDKKLQIVFY